METYIEKFDLFDHTIVYIFAKGYGGIGDLIKFFLILLKICITNNIKLYYCNNNTSINKYLKLKYSKMYANDLILQNSTAIKSFKDIKKLDSNIIYTITPFALYSFGKLRLLKDISPVISESVYDVFYFTDDIKINARTIIDSVSYISVHIRLGDYYLETDKKYVVCKNDKRVFNEDILFTFLRNNTDKKILLCCDSHNYKQRIIQQFKHVISTNYDIGHTSLTNTTDLQTMNTLVEFYLLSMSDTIYMAAPSGFPIMASLCNNIPIIDLVQPPAHPSSLYCKDESGSAPPPSNTSAHH